MHFFQSHSGLRRTVCFTCISSLIWGPTNIPFLNLMFIGPCIILIVDQRETNLMSLAFLFNYLKLNMFRMLIHPSSIACDLFVELFHGLYCSGTMCVSVTLCFGWGGVVSGCRLKHCFILRLHVSEQRVCALYTLI